MKTDLTKVGLDCKWTDLTEGMQVYGSATSKDFMTGEWTNIKPVLDQSKCIDCLLCVPVCPDSCISAKEGKRGPLDLNHCKGCGICVKNCPTGALTMEGVK